MTTPKTKKRLQQERDAVNREMTASKRKAGLVWGRADSRAERDWLRQIETMPVDTRGLTARFCGDPLPGRSALDRRSPTSSS